jgi:tetratricopeptide (TPR) repeat protein
MSMVASKWLWLLVAAAVISTLLSLWIVLGFPEQRIPPELPDVPDLSGWPEEFRQRVVEADAGADEGDVEALRELALLYHANGFYTEAALAYGHVRSHGDAGGIWTYCAALAAREAGDQDEALRLLKTTLHRRDDMPVAHALMAGLLFKQGRLGDAERHYRRIGARRGSRDQAVTVVGLGRIAAAREEWGQVVKLVEPLAAERPELRVPHQLLAEAYQALGRGEDAAREQQVLQFADLISTPPPDDPCRASLNDRCYSATMLLRRAGIAGRFGDSTAAIWFARRAVRLAPDDADAHQLLALLLVESPGTGPEVAAEALRHHQQALRFKPGDDAALIMLGKALTKKGMPDLAEGRFQLLLDRRPGSVDALLGLASAKTAQGRHAEAIEDLRRALELEPDSAVAHSSMGVILTRMGRPGEAVDHWLEAVRLNPFDAQSQFNLGMAVEKGIWAEWSVAGRAERLQEAERYFRAALRANPTDPRTHLKLWALLTETGRTTEAEQHRREALRLDPRLGAAGPPR